PIVRGPAANYDVARLGRDGREGEVTSLVAGLRGRQTIGGEPAQSFLLTRELKRDRRDVVNGLINFTWVSQGHGRENQGQIAMKPDELHPAARAKLDGTSRTVGRYVSGVDDARTQ